MTDVARVTPSQELVRRVRGNEFMQQVALALPAGMPPERFVRATVTALMQNPALAEQASQESIFTALLRSAQDGLVPDGHEAALVVYNGKAQYLPMIGGYRKIAGEHGWALDTAVVKQADEFEYERGLDPKVRHVVRPGVERGQTVAAYCIARSGTGQRLVEVMMLDELEQIRATSKKPTSGPWKDWTDRMYEKTVGKRAFAKLPLGELDARTLRVMEAADTPAPEAERLIYGTVIEDSPALPAGAGADDEPGADQQAAAASSPPAAAAPGSDELEGEPGPSEESAFKIPASVPDDTAVFMAQAAAQVVVPMTGSKWHGKSLGEVAADPSGAGWFRYALREFTDESGTGESASPRMRPGEFVQAIYAFCRVYLPDEYQAALAAKEAAA